MTKATGDTKFERAVKIWISQNFYDSKRRNLKVELIDRVEFGPYQGGYCETCAYDSVGVTWTYNGDFRVEELDYSSRNVAGFVEEIAKIAATLN